MTKNHPCLQCEIHLNGIDKKNNAKCAACNLPEIYDNQIRNSQPTTINKAKSKTPALISSKSSKKKKRQCDITGCSEPYLAKGLCQKHYYKSKSKKANKMEPKNKKTKLFKNEEILLNDDLWEKLEEISETEMRPTTYQAAYFIKQGIENYLRTQRSPKE